MQVAEKTITKKFSLLASSPSPPPSHRCASGAQASGANDARRLRYHPNSKTTKTTIISAKENKKGYENCIVWLLVVQMHVYDYGSLLPE